ncbi:MAG: beta-lactamase family protein [Acidobacteria bacterium]|nr:beta-lactamase family protein [Acidobacteriota bacterium]
MARIRVPTWLILIAGVVGLAVVAIVGTVVFVNVSSTPLHQRAKDVPSEMRSTPAARWTGAVEQARQTVRAGIVEQNLPGVSAAVGVGGEIVWAEGFGWATIEGRVPVSPEMRFRIGHVSKALTSAGVGLLREQGKLHLDDEIQKYVPSFPTKPWPVTLRQLMGHMAGVHHYRDTEWGDKPSTHCARAIEGMPAFASDPLLFEPETKYGYSTYGWVLVSAAVEAVAGESFFEFMRTKVFAKIGMTETTSEAASGVTDRVTSYYRGNLGRELTTSVDYSCFAGGGAFLSTPSDLVRFGMALNGGTFLQADTVRLLQARQSLKTGEDTQYGLGWMLDTIELAGQRTPVAGHSSRTIEGASTSFLIFPERGIVVAVASNISFADARSIGVKIAEAFAKARTLSGHD